MPRNVYNSWARDHSLAREYLTMGWLTLPTRTRVLIVCMLSLAFLGEWSPGWGQPPVSSSDQEHETPADPGFTEEPAQGSQSATDPQDRAGQTSDADVPPPPSLKLLWLIARGGPIMAVLAMLLVAVLAISIDRWLAVRESRIIPRALLQSLGELTESKQGLDPAVAYLVCQDHPSPTATVLRAMLLKVGRPQAEVDRVASDAAQREASRLYAPARWLSVIAGVSPLLGLVGTVWGLIQAFYQSTQVSADQNRANFLAGGIYEALVTTLGGLIVAIPAAILAHYFEGRIESAFHRVEELVLNLAPHLERFEGRVQAEPTSAEQLPPAPPPRSPRAGAHAKE